MTSTRLTPLLPRATAHVPRYPQLGCRLAVLVGMGSAASCGGADGGYTRNPEWTQFTRDATGGTARAAGTSTQPNAGTAGMSGNSAVAGQAGIGFAGGGASGADS
jgi:hypothetical protein